MSGEPIVSWLCRDPLKYRSLKWTSNVPQAVSLVDDTIDVFGQVLMKLNTLPNRGRCCGGLLGARIHGGQVVIAEIDPADLRHGILSSWSSKYHSWNKSILGIHLLKSVHVLYKHDYGHPKSLCICFPSDSVLEKPEPEVQQEDTSEACK